MLPQPEDEYCFDPGSDDEERDHDDGVTLEGMLHLRSNRLALLATNAAEHIETKRQPVGSRNEERRDLPGRREERS